MFSNTDVSVETPVKLLPSIAGKAPVTFAAVKFVKDAPLIAGRLPVSLDELTPV